MTELYERVRRKLFGGHTPNAFVRLLNDRAGIRGPVQGTPDDFSQVLFELTRGELNKRDGMVVYEMTDNGKKDLLKFKDGSRFRVVKAKGVVTGPMIVVTPHQPSPDEMRGARELPLASLVQDSLKIREAYSNVAIQYRAEEGKLQAEKDAWEQKIARESSVDTALAMVEKARSGMTIMIRGLQNIDALVRLGFRPGLIENPDNWIDADDFPGMRYRHARSGVELLLTGRERFRPIEELNRLEFHFLVHRSDDNPADYGRMVRKFRETKTWDGTPYSVKEFHEDLVALVKYPEELKGRTEEDLGLVADEVGHVIDRRQELDKGILPYEAVFSRDTQAIIAHIRKNGTPPGEIRKALDYFEYTGMIDQEYKAALRREIQAATAGPAAPVHGDILYDKRVKEIVADVLRKIPREHLTPATITIALTPYVGELGFGKLVRIRERILQLKEMVHDQYQ